MGLSQKLFNLLPNIAVKDGKLLKRLNKAGDIMSRPMENRLIMGGTAIISQPFIDEHNKRVDKDTARASRNRTIGKILAGTFVGCMVRGAVFKLVNMTTDKDISVDRWNNFLTPRSSSKVMLQMLKNRLLNYRTAFATILSLFIMLGTNIVIDMPLTNKISNFLNKRDAKKKQRNMELERPVQPLQPPAENIKDVFNMSSKGGSL